MGFLFSGLLWALLFLFVAVVLVAVTPILFRFQVRTAPEFKLICEAQLLGGLLPAIPLIDTAQKREKSVKKPAATKPKRQRERKKGNWSRSDICRLVRAGAQLVPDILRLFHLKRLEGHIEFGCADPADTGQLAGLAYATAHGLPSGPRMSLTAVPNFEQRCFEGQLTAVIQVTIAAFFAPILRFAWRVWGPVR